MTFINTGQLREQTGMLERQAGKYERLIVSLEEITNWLKRQQFKEVEEFQRILAEESENLELQKKEMFLLAGSLERICDRCESTEQKIVDYREQKSDIPSWIGTMDISKVQDLVCLYGGVKLK